MKCAHQCLLAATWFRLALALDKSEIRLEEGWRRWREREGWGAVVRAGKGRVLMPGVRGSCPVKIVAASRLETG